MRQVRVYVDMKPAGVLTETAPGHYQFTYDENYLGAPVSLTMPRQQRTYHYERFPPFFEGLLPEGILLEALLRKYKLDKNDYLGQLIKVGENVVGNVTVEEI